VGFLELWREFLSEVSVGCCRPFLWPSDSSDHVVCTSDDRSGMRFKDRDVGIGAQKYRQKQCLEIVLDSRV
jgi:hypothetical protein